MIKPGDVWLTIPDAARRISRSQSTVQRWVRERRLPCYLGMVNEHALVLCARDARLARSTPRGIVAGQRANALDSLTVDDYAL